MSTIGREISSCCFEDIFAGQHIVYTAVRCKGIYVLKCSAIAESVLQTRSILWHELSGDNIRHRSYHAASAITAS